MTQYNTLNVKFSNSQFNKLKSVIKNGTQITLNLSWNVVSNSNDVLIFLHKLLLINTHKFPGFVKSFWIFCQLIQSYRKLSCLRCYS